MSEFDRLLPGKAQLQAFVTAIEQHRWTYDRWELFGDFLEMTFCSMHVAALKVAGEEGTAFEARYARAIERYPEGFRPLFGELYHLLVEALEANPEQDALGQIFMNLDVNNQFRGQYMTPYEIARLTNALAFDSRAVDRALAQGRPLIVEEPSVGSGVMLIALRNRLVREGYSPHLCCLAHGTDLDRRCAQMAYIQTTLLGLPAVIHQGDTLKMEISASYANLHVTEMLSHFRGTGQAKTVREKQGERGAAD